eukprot:CAMPEP_0184861280 /NCGR_PEP_ID=MMETSP0580-20130426/6000_1 /TAXON_ID=1118495 /ORGANISM="Dactyliosolen fragilissimus" /LENGTH=833 /DNA_ID=CAMNT_0027358707 /DNA_START=17 /DNA_END=2518 /DNA_ORIENTATION=-
MPRRRNKGDKEVSSPKSIRRNKSDKEVSSPKSENSSSIQEDGVKSKPRWRRNKSTSTVQSSSTKSPSKEDTSVHNSSSGTIPDDESSSTMGINNLKVISIHNDNNNDNDHHRQSSVPLVTETESSQSSSSITATSTTNTHHNDKSSKATFKDNKKVEDYDHQWSKRSELAILHNSISNFDQTLISETNDSNNINPKKNNIHNNNHPHPSHDHSFSIHTSSSKNNKPRPASFRSKSTGSIVVENQMDDISQHKWLSLSDDPTVEESIECVFAHQIDTKDYWDKKISNSSPENRNRLENGVQLKRGRSTLSTLFCGAFGGGVGVGDGYMNSYYGMNLDDEDKDRFHHMFINDNQLKHDVLQSQYQTNNTKLSPPNYHHDKYNLQDSSQLLYLGSIFPSSSEDMSQLEEINDELTTNPSCTTHNPNNKLHTPHNNDNTYRFQCKLCTENKNHFPNLPIENWPQRPFFLRPTPGSSTRIKGVRFSGDEEYLWSANNNDLDHNNNSTTDWWDKLNETWKSHNSGNKTNNNNNSNNNLPSMCPQCYCIPLNNGNESKGKSLFIDFESDSFLGTLMIRVRHSNGSTPEPYNDNYGYFSGVNRQYQCVIQGRFKKGNIPMTECVTGQIFTRPLTKLPHRLICRGAIKVLSFFAPRLQASFDGSTPMAISPLGSTPQTLIVKHASSIAKNKYQADSHLEDHLEEPTEDSERLIPLSSKPNPSTSSMTRAKARKKTFDVLCKNNNKSLLFDTNRVYTFEFLQHLINFTTFEVNLGSMGKLSLNEILNGQPLKIMSAHQHNLEEGEQLNGRIAVNEQILDVFWSFEIWHEKLIHDAKLNQKCSA